MGGNLFWGMQFRRFGKSPQDTDLSPLSLCRFTKNYKSHTAITSIAIRCTNRLRIKRICNIPSLRAQFIARGNPFYKKLRFCDSQNLVKKSNKKSLTKFLLLFAFAKRRVPLYLVIARKSV